jgi:hypothetical protein
MNNLLENASRTPAVSRKYAGTGLFCTKLTVINQCFIFVVSFHWNIMETFERWIRLCRNAA